MTVPRIRFHTTLVRVSLKNRKVLKQFLATVFAKEGINLRTLDYIFCSDQELLDINRRFLQHDDLTDIITFDMSEGNALVGEIYISVDRVKENAVQFQTPFPKELHRVIFHGVLHLCGYNDKSEKEKQLMRNRENELLDNYLK